VGGFLYIAIGMAYNYKFKGQTGVEMIPNIEFWRGLPSLLKVCACGDPRAVVLARADLLVGGLGRGGASRSQDGAVFSYQKITGLCKSG